MSEIAKRIENYTQYKCITTNTLARKSGVDTANMSRMMRGLQPISQRTLQRIENAFPDLNPNWLEDGEGEMLRPIVHNEQHANGDNNTQTIAPPCDVDKLVDEIAELRKLLQASEQRTARLLSIIENLTK